MPIQKDIDQEISVRNLYPHLSEQELEEAAENLGRYIELVLRIHERIRLDPQAYARFRALTGSSLRPTMKGRSNSS